MPTTKSEPWVFASLGELLAMAASMEQEAIDGYGALSKRMAEMARPELALVFDSLIKEESEHLGKVKAWTAHLGLPETTSKPEASEPRFDNEGAGIVAPELLSAYRAFSIAVRNEERAFTFWSYVSAHAGSDEIRQAAERMAGEELGHVAKLRQERRKAFHQDREGNKDVVPDMTALEDALVRHLEDTAAHEQGIAINDLQNHARAARARRESLMERPFELGSQLRIGDKVILAGPFALSEHLLDCYLYLGDHSKSEQDANRARSFAGQLISTIRSIRDATANTAI